MNPQYSHWCFTFFSDDESPGPFDEKRVRYAVFQLEESKEGRLHWQGYVEMDRNQRMAAVQKAIGVPKGTHFEPRRGTREQARAYCMKNESRVIGPQYLVGPFEFGRWELNPGKRNDLKSATECKSIDEVKSNYPTVYVKYFRGLEKLLVPEDDVDFKPTVMVLWGKGRDTGKGHAWKNFKKKYNLSHYRKTPSQWWDHYNCQDLTVVEDFNPREQKWCTASTFKNIFDYGTDRVAGKGQADVQFKSQMVIFTSNYDPQGWFPEEDWMVIKKRIAKIIHCGDEHDKYVNWLADIESAMSAHLPALVEGAPGQALRPSSVPVSEPPGTPPSEEDNVDWGEPETPPPQGAS